MNFLVIATFVCCVLAGYLAKDLKLISVYFLLLPELLAGIALLVVFGRLVLGKRLELDGRYLVFLGLLFLTIMIGTVVQQVPAGAIISGLRDYVRFLPFLLLAAIYPFTARQIRAQLAVLGLLLLVQVPIAVYQRFFAFSNKMHTGDVVTGTVSESHALSILMLSGVAVLAVLYLKKRLSLVVLLAATGFLTLPTMLNETKATIVMLPIAMLAPLFVMRGKERPLRRLLPLVAVFAMSGVAFIGVYNAMIQHRNPESSMQQFWLEGGLQNYMYKGSLEGDPRIGRIDSVQLAIEGISKDPMTAAFGLGIGNVSTSQLSGFEGEYAQYYDLYKASFTQLSMFLWNLGYAGVLVFGLLFFAMFRDAVLLARSESPMTTLGQVWTPLVLIAAMCIFYKSILTDDSIMYPLMFYAGIVARHASLVRRERRAQRRRARTIATEGAVWHPSSAMARQ